MTTIEKTLKDTFGYYGFRPGQKDVVYTIRPGRKGVAVMPTGSGKSRC